MNSTFNHGTPDIYVPLRRELKESDFRKKAYIIQTFTENMKPKELICYLNGFGFHFKRFSSLLDVRIKDAEEIGLTSNYNPNKALQEPDTGLILITEYNLFTDETLNEYWEHREEKIKEIMKARKLDVAPAEFTPILKRDPLPTPVFVKSKAYFKTGEVIPTFRFTHHLPLQKEKENKPKEIDSNTLAIEIIDLLYFASEENTLETQIVKGFIEDIVEYKNNPEGHIHAHFFDIYPDQFLDLTYSISNFIEQNTKNQVFTENSLEPATKNKPDMTLLQPESKNFLELQVPYFRELSAPLTEDKKTGIVKNGKEVYSHKITATIDGEQIETDMLTLQPTEIIQLNQLGDFLPSTLNPDTKLDLLSAYTLIAPLDYNNFPVLIPLKIINEQLTYKSFSKSRRKKMEQNFQICDQTQFKYNWKEEAKLRQKLNKIRPEIIELYGEQFFATPKAESLLKSEPYAYVDESGNIIHCILILKKPYFLAHAQATGQITTIDRKFISIEGAGFNRSNEKNNSLIMEIASRVCNEIYWKEKRKHEAKTFNINILSTCNKLKIPLKNKQAKSRILTIIEEILGYYQQKKLIKKYEEVKEGRVITSIKITI